MTAYCHNVSALSKSLEKMVTSNDSGKALKVERLKYDSNKTDLWEISNRIKIDCNFTDVSIYRLEDE